MSSVRRPHSKNYLKKNNIYGIIALIIILIFIYYPTEYGDEILDFDPIQSELDSLFAEYFEITYQGYVEEITIVVESQSPLDIYVVGSEVEFDNFIEGEDFQVYTGCYKYGEYSSKFICTVSEGGIIVSNPNGYKVSFSINIEEPTTNNLQLSLDAISFETINQDLELNKEDYPDDFSSMEYTHWGHMPLTYSVRNPLECGSYIERLHSGFNNLTYDTNNHISFRLIDNLDEADIEVECIQSDDYQYETLGEADFINIDNLIVKGYITYYVRGSTEIKWVYNCQDIYPQVEVHEILHTFGMGHNPRGYHLMQSGIYNDECRDVDLSKEYKDCLKHIYTNGRVNGECQNVPFTDLNETYYSD